MKQHLNFLILLIDEFLKKNEENQDIKINDFILREKLLNSLVINLTNLTTLLKLQLFTVKILILQLLF